MFYGTLLRAFQGYNQACQTRGRPIIYQWPSKSLSFSTCLFHYIFYENYNLDEHTCTNHGWSEAASDNVETVDFFKIQNIYNYLRIITLALFIEKVL